MLQTQLAVYLGPRDMKLGVRGETSGSTPTDRGRTSCHNILFERERADRFPLEHVRGHLCGYRHQCCYCRRRCSTKCSTVVPTAIVALAIAAWSRLLFLHITAAMCHYRHRCWCFCHRRGATATVAPTDVVTLALFAPSTLFLDLRAAT